MTFSIVMAFMQMIFSTVPSNPSLNETKTSLPPFVYQNVAYGDDPKQVMDIYLPENRSEQTTKLLFLIHGGSWSSGDKNAFKQYIDSLKERLPGYAMVNINYRLANAYQNKFPTQENDVKTALSFVLNRSAEYGISHDVVLLGASAGAHLALLQAYKYTEPVKVKAVVSFFGPSDFKYMYDNPVFPQVPQLLELLLGGNPRDNSAVFFGSSPINFVTAQSCPTLIFQGGLDPVVNPKQSEMLKEKLQKEGVTNKLIVYPNEGHGWHGKNLSDSFDKITAFLTKEVK